MHKVRCLNDPPNKWLRLATRLLSLVVLSAVLASVTTVCAQGQENIFAKAADRLLDEGLELLDEGSESSVQKAIEKFDTARFVYEGMGDYASALSALGYIGSAYLRLRDYPVALKVFNQALGRCQKQKCGHEDTLLNNIGIAYYGSGDNLTALKYFEKALKLRKDAKDPSKKALTLSSMAHVYHTLGKRETAIEFFKRAEQFYEQINDRPFLAITLYNIGKCYADLRRYDEALEFYEKAVKLLRPGEVLKLRGLVSRAGGSHIEAAILIGIGEVAYFQGDYQKAINYLQQAWAFDESVGDDAGKATVLGDIAVIHFELGAHTLAVENLQKVLTLRRKHNDRPGEAMALNNLCILYLGMNNKTQALDSCSQAHKLYVGLQDKAGEAMTLNSIGRVYSAMRDWQRALGKYKHALKIYGDLKDRSGEAGTRNNIGLVSYDLGKPLDAIPEMMRALTLLRQIGEFSSEAETLANLMYAWKNSNDELAIFFGKQAINSYQQLRRNIRGFNETLQQTFVRSKENTYRELASLLIAKGRLPEAQRVIAMLKEEEYLGFVRRDPGGSALAAARIAFTPAEADLEKQFNQLILSIVSIGAQRAALLEKPDRTPQEEDLLSLLGKRLEIANRGFEKFLVQLDAELKTSKPGSNAVFQIREAQILMNILRDRKAVALYTLVTKDYYRVILMTADARKAYEYAIKAEDLNKKIYAFRDLLENPNSDPLPLAQELYRILIGPELARDIRQSGNHTIVWSLDGALRYMPVAALHDGRQYLVENFSNVLITLASQDHLNDHISPKWEALGLGVSKTHTVDGINFPPLPGVLKELAVLVRSEAKADEPKGLFTGRVMLDDDFTSEAMIMALRLRANDQPFKLVHIASHFQFEPGDDTKSFLLLGGGKKLTVDELKHSPNVFSKVELLTLSACNTATGDDRAPGAEVEGFAASAQRQGAEAIVATLWRVDDSSTSQLMQHFYRLRVDNPEISKAEALRQAQLRFLASGEPSTTTSNQSNTAGQTHSYAHPYFWAPFILVGNWR